MTNITAIILTKNEEVNIARCINSIKNIADRICVVDSGSTDSTIKIAESLGAEIFHHEPFEHYAAQFNWAVDNLGITTTWVFRIDADEEVPQELALEIVEQCQLHMNDDVNGMLMKFKVYFLGKFLKHGGVYPFTKITLYKPNKGRFENRAMGEHIILSEGKCIELKNDCLHYDFKSLDAWINKHNWYATREVSDYIAVRTIGQADRNDLYNEAKKASKLRDGLYYRLPKFMRAKLYFIYRYYVRLGFLDGKAGYVHAFLQAYWYRFLVDAKIMEYELRNKSKEIR